MPDPFSGLAEKAGGKIVGGRGGTATLRLRGLQGILDELIIPLPPLATQRAIVAEIEAEQALVNANRELITRFEKKIQAVLARVWGEEPA